MGLFAFCHRALALRALFGLAVFSFPFMHRYTDGISRDSPPTDILASACWILFCIHASKDAVMFFSTKVSYFLGEISFPLYSLSSLVIGTLQSELIIRIISAGMNSRETELAVLCALITGIVLIILSCIVRFLEMGYLCVLDKAVVLLVYPYRMLEKKETYNPVPEMDDLHDTEKGTSVEVEVAKLWSPLQRVVLQRIREYNKKERLASFCNCIFRRSGLPELSHDQLVREISRYVSICMCYGR